MNLSLALSGTLQRCVETSDQALVVKGLFEKATSPCRERARADPFFGKGRDEDDWYAVTVFDQSTLQFETVETWHLHVGDQAQGVMHAFGSQKFLG
jgi:hypothetical protein